MRRIIAVALIVGSLCRADIGNYYDDEPTDDEVIEYYFSGESEPDPYEETYVDKEEEVEAEASDAAYSVTITPDL